MAAVYVIEQTDQFQKLGKNLARKCEIKKIKKSDLNKKSDVNKKKSDFFIFVK